MYLSDSIGATTVAKLQDYARAKWHVLVYDINTAASGRYD